MPARFRRRAAIAFGVFLGFAAVGFGTLLSLLLGRSGAPHRGGALLVVIAFAALAVVTVAIFRRWATPVGDLMEATERVAAGDLATRVAVRGRPEMRRMLDTFNDMADRLQRDEARRRRLLADVTHELRTPLTVVRGGLEAIRDGIHQPDRERLASLLDETRRMEHLVDDLRTLALADAGALPLHREPTDPGDLIGRAVSAFEAEAAAAGLRLVREERVDVGAVDVDPVRIHQVLANLLSNAIRHTPRGGAVTVAAARDGRQVRFTVDDTGAGIPADELARVFERFHHAPGTGGSGLGLAIARDIVLAHGGTIGAGAAPGGGARFWFDVGAT